MKTRALINFAVSQEKKAQYVEAVRILGVSVSEICRKALDNAIILSETVKTSKTQVPATSSPAKEEAGSTPAPASPSSTTEGVTP